jgi:CrcB protein
LHLIWIGLAGAAGALTRYLLGLWLGGILPPGWPWATFLMNISGSFLLGLVTGLGAERGLIPEQWRTPIGTGFLGAYTTFSTFSVETLALLAAGRPGAALAYALLSIGLGLSAAWLGLSLARKPEVAAPQARNEV